MKKIIIYAVIFAVAIISANLLLKGLFPMRYESTIETCSAEYRIDKDLLAGVIYAESGFDPQANSGKAIGLMQITEDTAKWICEKLDIEFSQEMLYDPETNIQMGSYYLAYLITHYENVQTALAAYNAGMGNVSKWLSDKRYSPDGVILTQIPYGETKKYIQRIKKFSSIYDILY